MLEVFLFLFLFWFTFLFTFLFLFFLLEDILFFLSLGKEIYGKPMKDRLSREKMK